MGLGAEYLNQIPDLRDLPVDVKRHPLVREVHRRLEQHAGIDAGEFVMVGVSGGADSVALLLAMAAIGSRTTRTGTPHVRPIAVHVHHHLRDTADDDATFVDELCRRLGVTCHMVDIDAGGRRGNVAAVARAMRYHALAEQAGHDGSTLVAVAHHAEDQLETMLMALGRGAGLDGLAGMPWIRPLKGDVRLIRPLLGSRRAACEELCRTAGVQWMDDPTNQDRTRSRARIRHDVIPVLEELWPNVAQRTTATSELMRTAARVLDASLDASFGDADQRTWSRQTLSAMPLPMLTAGLRRAALRVAPEAADQLSHRLVEGTGLLIQDAAHDAKSVDWPCGLRVELDRNTVRLHWRNGAC